MWRREQHCDGGDNRKEREHDQTEPVHHHRRKFPIANQVLLLVPLLHPARDELQLLQDEMQILMRAPAHRVLLNRRWPIETAEREGSI